MTVSIWIGFEQTQHRCGFKKIDIPLPAWMIADQRLDDDGRAVHREVRASVQITAHS